MKVFVFLITSLVLAKHTLAHPIEQFQGLWQGNCFITGLPETLMTLKIGPLKENRLQFILGYKIPPKDFEYRNYSLIVDQENFTKLILDEGDGALFEERWEQNTLYGLLRSGSIRMHSLFKFESQKRLSIQMTIFKFTPNKLFGPKDSPFEDYSPKSIQNCLLKK